MFKIGDKVRIKGRNLCEDKNDRPCFVKSMDKHCGHTFTVTEVHLKYGYIRYQGWNYHPDWIELVEDTNPCAELILPQAGDVFSYGNSFLFVMARNGKGGVFSEGWLKSALASYAKQDGVITIALCANLKFLYNVLKEFDCSDTDKETPPAGGSIGGQPPTKKEDVCMSAFKKGDRVYRNSIKPLGWCQNGDRGTVLSVNGSGSLKIQMDNGHVTKNGSSKRFKLVTPRNENSKGGSMNPFTIAIEEQTVVNGTVITKHTTDEELYSYINTAEAEIARLDKMKTKPASVTAKIASLNEGIAGIVAICDARTEAAAD